MQKKNYSNITFYNNNITQLTEKPIVCYPIKVVILCVRGFCGIFSSLFQLRGTRARGLLSLVRSRFSRRFLDVAHRQCRLQQAHYEDFRDCDGTSSELLCHELLHERQRWTWCGGFIHLLVLVRLEKRWDSSSTGHTHF